MDQAIPNHNCFGSGVERSDKNAMSSHASNTCLITNPSALGNKAKSFLLQKQNWTDLGVVMESTGPGDAEKLAFKAIKDGFETVIAAGGDGTVYEVLNGILSAECGFKEVKFGVLPLGTVNVFAKELGMPMDVSQCKEILLRGASWAMDLPLVSFQKKGAVYKRYFAQLGGAGLDAFAIQEVSFKLKKRLGPLAYVIAGLKVMGRNLPQIRCSTVDGKVVTGKLVLLGNGAYYGGRFRVFPDARLDDGLLHAIVFDDVRWFQLPWRGIGLWMDQLHFQSGVTYLKSTSIKLESNEAVPFELEGEFVDHLPIHLHMPKEKLQVISPR